MPEIKDVRDKSSESVPSIEEMRESQRAGGRSKGTNREDSKLNECQGHAVNLQD